MTTRTIAILPYDPTWPDAFRSLARPLRDALGERALRIDHIGSTSVPGLAAKDIIDIQITVADLDDDAMIAALSSLGYTLRDDITGDHVVPGWPDDPAEWEKRYVRVPTDARPYHLHVRQQGKANQRYALLFRDYLRASATAAGAYAQIKTALARLHPHDVDAYYDIKDPACDLIIDAAVHWAKDVAYTPGPSDA